ncbi:MAG: HAMP domain-containing histidine kinase [Clostridiales bacterium]|jgi:signal transduction histidine kinase|nr:HAMP domain-containing histidine kinase [Clostridiales bacterium]
MKTRIFLMLLGLLILVFASVLLAFNIFLRAYIRSDADAQIVSMALVYANDAPEDTIKGDGHKKERRRSKIGSDGDVLILDSDYEILKYEGITNMPEAEAESFAGTLRQEGADLQESRHRLIRAPLGEYYVSCMPDARTANAYLVFFVDVTTANAMADTVNTALVVILGFALAIAFAVSSSIANSVITPVRKLSSFAEEIGKGNFAQHDFPFFDLELASLARIMNQSAEKLSQYDSHQKVFFQNVSHELRTPLMSIKCHAEGIECGFMDEKKSSRIIEAEVDRLSNMVEDLLYISRLDSLAEIELKEGDVRELVESCAESVRAVAEKAGLALSFDFDSDCVLLCFNEKHLSRAIVNLLSNAIRHAKKEIRISCKTIGMNAVIAVADDGDGIASEDLPHIFERFYKGHNGKHGIGLSIAQSVAALHGGVISVDCRDGTKFVASFPGGGGR